MKAKISICCFQFFMLFIVLTSIIGCSKDDDEPIAIVINTDIEPLVDIDGNIYRAVEIGNQTWMVENLKVTHYRNGDLILHETSMLQWSKLLTGAWSYYKNEYDNNRLYGKLYNGIAMSDERGLAPEGWHVPSDTEWLTLINYLGENAGGKMKRNTGWIYPNTGATNISGFEGRPGGIRELAEVSWVQYIGNDMGEGLKGYWWSSTKRDNDHYSFLSLSYTSSDVGKWCHDLFCSTWKNNGLSVRCIKD